MIFDINWIFAANDECLFCGMFTVEHRKSCSFPRSMAVEFLFCFSF